MRETRISLPELALVAATRGMLGVGIGLLIANRIEQRRRVAVGWTLAIAGALTTIPLAFEVFGGGRMARIARIAKTNDRSRAPTEGEQMAH